MATIDPSIALNIRPPQIENPMNALARVMQIKGLQQDAELGRFNMEEKRRSVDENNRLNALFSSAVGPDGRLDRNRLLTGAAKGGLGSRIPGLQKQFLEQDKEQAELDTKKMEVASKRVDMMGQTLGFVLQNPTLENAVAAINHLVQNGAMPPEKGQEALAKFQANPTPEAIASFAELGFRAALSAKEQLAKFETRNLGGTTDTLAIDPVTGQTRTVNSARNTQSPDSVASTAVQIRGQNLSNDRARERLTFDKEKDARDRSPTGGKMTESQAKANLFGSRMSEAHRVLTELEGKYNPMAVNAKMTAAEAPLVGGAAGFVGNLMLSDEGQMAEQAMRDFINAVLRRESGAVISEPEFANAKKQYFPQPGDSEAVLAQKRRNRETAIRGMEAEVPGGLRSTPSLTNPGSTGGASGGWSIQKIN